MLAQISVEFTLLVSILVIILLLTIYYNSSIYVEMNSAKVYSDGQKISDQIASEINLALKAGNGYSRVFYTPIKVSNSFDYNITVNNYLVTVSWKDSSVRSVVLTNNLNGTLVKGQNLIKNLNGNVYVNQ